MFNSLSVEVSFKLLFRGNWSLYNDKIEVRWNGALFENIQTDTQLDSYCQYCQKEEFEQNIFFYKFTPNYIPNQNNIFTLTSNKTIYIREFTVSHVVCPPNSEYITSATNFECRCLEGYYRDPNITKITCMKCPISCSKCSAQAACPRCGVRCSECIESYELNLTLGLCLSKQRKILSKIFY